MDMDWDWESCTGKRQCTAGAFLERCGVEETFGPPRDVDVEDMNIEQHRIEIDPLQDRSVSKGINICQ